MASSKNGLPLPLIEFSRALRPLRFRAFLALSSLLTLFLLATFLAGDSSTSANSPFAIPAISAAAHYSSLVIRSLVPNPSKNQSDVVRDVGLLKNRAQKKESLEYGVPVVASCDLFDGNWVPDESSPRYQPGSCPFVDEAFNCFGNGRSDLDYTKLRWKPKGCEIQRLDGNGMLEMLRGRRMVFVGDSLNRNMWQSLVCMLRDSLPDKDKVFDVSGRHEFRTGGSYAVRFADFNCTIEFFRSPFLVQEWKVSDLKGGRKETLRLDVIHKSSTKYRDADIIIFNTGHWWTHTKTSQGKSFYQEGEHVHSQLSAADAYRKALSTWAKWVDTGGVNSNRTQVFFRGYSSSHFNGRWNSRGNCDGETLPTTDDTQPGKYPKMVSILESVVGAMKTPVRYLNITRMTDYRKDAHPSVFRQPEKERRPGAHQDCSHWCLPGVPDAWNELLYAMLLRNANHMQS